MVLTINSITKGIVIDHIKPGLGYELFKILELDKAEYTVALIMNATSSLYGRKDIIKIENVTDVDLDAIGIIDPTITVNYIENEKIYKKIHITLPEKIEASLQCTNPKCISTHERNVISHFSLVDHDKKIYKCDYCDHFYNMEEA